MDSSAAGTAGLYSRAILARFFWQTFRQDTGHIYLYVLPSPLMGRTLAIHWAATTHGTWLHGDPRGSWREGRLIGADPYLVAETRARMLRGAVMLDAAERSLVADAFGDVVREQGYRVLAATVQATHVHLVLAPVRESLDNVIARFKRRSAGAVLARRRELLANENSTGTAIQSAGTAGLYSRAILARRHSVPRHLWTAGKFPVFIFDDTHLVNAIEYVRDHNRHLGLPPDPFDWIDALYPAGEFAGERAGRGGVCETLPF
jgi:REP element-mobilizing transposase RayT